MYAWGQLSVTGSLVFFFCLLFVINFISLTPHVTNLLVTLQISVFTKNRLTTSSTLYYLMSYCIALCICITLLYVKYLCAVLGHSLEDSNLDTM